MTLAVEAASGIDAVSSNKGISKAVPWVGVAAGRRAYIGAYARPSTATLTTPTGFTLVKSRSGGVGADGSGVGTGVLYVWRSTSALTGTEIGTVTVAGSGVDAMDAGMVTVSAGNGFEADVAVSGNDAVHDTNRSVATDEGTLALATNDLLLGWFGSDRGVATAITAYSFTQTGATFGTPVEDNRQISNTNNDASLYSAHAPVTAGSTNTPTAGFTQATANCGPGIVVRVRESTPSVTGTGALTGAKGTLAGAGSVAMSGTGALTGHAGALAGAGTQSISGTGALTGASGTLAGAGTVLTPVAGVGSLTGSAGFLSGAGTVVDRIVRRPFTGVVARPDTGTVARP